MMKCYYIEIQTWGTNTPNIIDEEIMYQAERNMIDLNPDEFMFLCEDENMAGAKEQYWEDFSKMANDMETERLHP